MLPPMTVMEVRRLLDEGALSQRNIARNLGISRGTVHAIAAGKRPERGPERGPAAFFSPAAIPRRCPTCGGLVQMPCLLCHVRRLRGRQGLRRRSDDG